MVKTNWNKRMATISLSECSKACKCVSSGSSDYAIAIVLGTMTGIPVNHPSSVYLMAK